MAVLISVALFAFILISITGFGYVFFVRPRNLLHQLESMAGPAVDEQPVETVNKGGWKVVESLQWLGEKVPLSPEESSFTRNELVAAGFRGDHAVAVFTGIRMTVMGLVVPLAFIFRHDVVRSTLLGWVFVGFSAAVAYFLPGFGLGRLVDKRRQTLALSLADALDLLVTCVEAGQGIDQAMRVVARELEYSHKELSDELMLTSLETRAGTSRADALRHMAERTGEPELKKLVAVLIQTDRFGTSVGEALRTHSEYLRVRRTQLAEEKAGKVGVKLIFPIFFCIMPSVMIVAAGPGILMVIRGMAEMSK